MAEVIDTKEHPQAVSRAQVYWARAQLQNLSMGHTPRTSLSREALLALANTPLDRLPERVHRAPRRAESISQRRFYQGELDRLNAGLPMKWIKRMSREEIESMASTPEEGLPYRIPELARKHGKQLTSAEIEYLRKPSDDQGADHR